MKATLDDDLEVGDIIQCEGESVPHMRGRFFIVRALEPDLELSWPYLDSACLHLDLPRKPGQLERDWLADCLAMTQRERAADIRIGRTSLIH